MGLKRYIATKDNIITNGFNYTLTTRGTGSNMGYADSLEVYSIYGQVSSSTTGRTQELARTIVEFPISTVITDRAADILPASGSVSFYLRMFNVETAFTLPEDFTLDIFALSQSWSEGTGLDMDEYSDIGTSNWIERSKNTPWTGSTGTHTSPSSPSIGGSWHASPSFSAVFSKGYEDLEVDVSDVVEQWIAGTKQNYGFIVKLTDTDEAHYSSSTGANESGSSIVNNPTGAKNTYYTKRFSARSSQYFFKRPIIEARWNNRILDNRENFYYSSSRAPLQDNLNTLYFYNYVRGRLVDLPNVGTSPILISFYSSSVATPAGGKLLLPAGGDVAAAGDVNVTGGYVSTGIYSCSLSLTAASTPLAAVHDVWHSGSTEYFTGSIYPELMPTYKSAPTFSWITSATNLKKQYSRQETARFRFFIRNKNWSPTIYTVATPNNPTDIIESASYSITRVADNFGAIPYGTGSNLHTLLSYDDDGNYFDVDIDMLEADYMYKIKLSYYNDSIGSWVEQPGEFKFRVEE